ncbi:type II secretion system protein [Pseudoteredinibacter isoporae]|uniref:type II secretion system protein n=1 Tax=Pseudoteredinibacter isoporae TaxID=570281 RepID=UPI003101F16C
MSLLEMMLVLTILAMASSLVIYRYSPNTSQQQWLQLEKLLQSSRDQSFYRQTRIRLSCTQSGIQQQRSSRSGIRVIPGQGHNHEQWQDTEQRLQLTSTVCLYEAQESRCIPCPGSESQSKIASSDFNITFSDGLADDSVLLTDAKNDEEGFTAQTGDGLKVYAHGHIEALGANE